MGTTPSEAGPDALRILFLNSWPLDPTIGSGSAVAISGLAAGLEALGHRVIQLAAGGTGRTVQRLIYNLSLPWKLPRESFNLVVGFDLDGFLVAGTARPHYAVALKGILADEMRFETGITRRRLRLLSALERRNVERAEVVIVTSQYSRSVALRHYEIAPELVRVVPEGIDVSAWMGLTDSAREARAHAPTVLSVGRQYPRKNTATLLDAFARVRVTLPRARLRIVGGGPELPRLRARVARMGLDEAVELRGELPTAAAVRAEYARAHVFCLPSLQEGFGIVFLEAMAAGLPVVGSNAAAIPEVVPHGSAGFLVDPRDSGAIADALLMILRDSDLRGRLGRFGRAYVRRYDWPHVARSFLRETL